MADQPMTGPGRSDLRGPGEEEPAGVEYRRLVERLPDAVYRHELPGNRIVYISPAVEHLTGFSPREILAMGMSGVIRRVHPEDVQRLGVYPAGWQRVGVEPGQPLEFEARWRHRGGEYRWFRNSFTLEADPAGRPLAVVGVVSNGTDHLQAEADRDAARQAAHCAQRAMGRFLAGVSHELRTHMNGILGLAELCLDHDLPPPVRGYCGTIRTAARALPAMLTDLLDLAELDAGRLQLELADFRTAAWLAEVGGAERFAVRLDPATPEVLRGDADRLAKILRHLSGILRDRHRNVRLRLDVRPYGPVPLSTGAVCLWFEFQEESTRPGRSGDIPDDSREAIRLQVCRSLIDKMGGEFRPGEGQFGFTAFFGPGRLRSTAPPPPAQAPPPTEPLRVLLVEDNRVNQEVAGHFLERLSHRVEVAGDGAAALERLPRGGVDLVLMDVDLPGMDGLETTRRIRAGEAGPAAARLPVLALTAHALRGDRHRCLSAGMDGYITKPVELDELARGIAEAVARRRSEA